MAFTYGGSRADFYCSPPLSFPSVLIIEMTGLLSVFSLLPVQTLKSQEEAEDEQEQRGKGDKSRPLSPHEDGIERY